MYDVGLIKKTTKERYTISKAYLQQTPNGEMVFLKVYQSNELEKDFFGNIVYHTISMNDVLEHFDVEPSLMKEGYSQMDEFERKLREWDEKLATSKAVLETRINNIPEQISNIAIDHTAHNRLDTIDRLIKEESYFTAKISAYDEMQIWIDEALENINQEKA